MKLKGIGFLMAVAMVVGMMVLPASAATPAGTHVGAFSATAEVGKTSDGCPNNGVSDVDGGGLGLPVVTDKHILEWAITNGTAVDVPAGIGSVNLCGSLKDSVALGASCASTIGHSGKGLADFADVDVFLTDVGWLPAAGGTLVVSGRAAGSSTGGDPDGKKRVETLTALVQVAPGDESCFTKGAVNPTKSGEQPFTVAAAYVIA